MAAATLVLAACATPPRADDRPLVVRHARPGSTAPTSSAVEVRDGAATVYVSGHVPPMSAATPEQPARPAAGTKAQAIGTLQAIERTLADLGLGLGDVVKVTAFLVADPASGGRMDSAGFNDAFGQFFGTPSQPNRPARSVVQIVGLSNPAWLVAIEVVAVRSGHRQAGDDVAGPPVRP